MSVYVDNYRTTIYAAHMMADTREELDAMATRIGLSQGSRQKSGHPHEHYDLTPRKRALAVRYGAYEVTTRDLIRIARRKQP